MHRVGLLALVFTALLAEQEGVYVEIKLVFKHAKSQLSACFIASGIEKVALAELWVSQVTILLLLWHDVGNVASLCWYKRCLDRKVLMCQLCL